jgi:hypothetical protein
MNNEKISGLNDPISDHKTKSTSYLNNMNLNAYDDTDEGAKEIAV